MIPAIFFLLLIVVIWGSMLLPLAPLLIVAFVFDKVEKKDRVNGWFESIFYATDILTNVFLGGYKRTTISAELGNLRSIGSNGGTMAANFVDWCWQIVFKEENHCTIAMEREDKYFFSPFKAICGACFYLMTYFYLALGMFSMITHYIYF